MNPQPTTASVAPSGVIEATCGAKKKNIAVAIIAACKPFSSYDLAKLYATPITKSKAIIANVPNHISPFNDFICCPNVLSAKKLLNAFIGALFISVANEPIIVNGIIATKASLTATKCLCAPILAAYGVMYLSIKAINFSISFPYLYLDIFIISH